MLSPRLLKWHAGSTPLTPYPPIFCWAARRQFPRRSYRPLGRKASASESSRRLLLQKQNKLGRIVRDNRIGTAVHHTLPLLRLVWGPRDHLQAGLMGRVHLRLG